MSKSNFIVIIIIIILINTLMLFYYDKNYRKQNAIAVLNRVPIMSSAYRSEDNEKIDNARQTAITEAVKIIEPAVVSVNVLKTQIVRRNPFFDDFFFDFFGMPLRREVQSIGSGVLFTPDGYIITNSHVVEGATQIKVVMNNNEEYDANLIGLDSVHDIAIIKINCRNLPHARLGISSDLMIGEWSIAVGNPYGFLMKDSKPSVSVGVISALNRNFNNKNDSKVYKGMIQTDAAINPGNSGGPLVNIYGEVIGINAFIFTETGGSIGIGFAIPVDRVKKIAEELIKFGRIREAYFGFKIQEITPLIASYLNLKSLDGVIVSTVELSGPAHVAGLKRGDIITKINDIVIKNSADAEIGVSDIAPGDTAYLSVIRDGKTMEFSIIAGEYR